MEKIKIEILNNYFMKNGKFDKEEAINFCGKIAGVCYSKEGYSKLENEELEKTNRRIDLTINSGHHSVYDHVKITFNMHNIPKILAMILNNEHDYTTSEKSARYTPIERKDDSIITDKEVELYNKWLEILKIKINETYGDVYDEVKIKKLAQENARYFVTVFMPTEMIYTTSLRQINYLASWLIDYTFKSEDDMDRKLTEAINMFINELERLNVLDKRLMRNAKYRKISLVGQNLSKKEIHFGDVYSTIYTGSFASLAQAQRHRTLDYQMERLGDKGYFIPPIIKSDEMLVNEWLNDMDEVANIIPQGELVLISEIGKYEDFILKCKERLCSSAQLEIMYQTKETLLKYQKALKESNSPLFLDIQKYTHGARCTFPDFKCSNPTCKTKIRKLDRKI